MLFYIDNPYPPIKLRYIPCRKIFLYRKLQHLKYSVQGNNNILKGMKRMSDMDAEESPVKRPRPTGDTELRLLIQSKAAGSVIGKGGQNISRLRSEFNLEI
ncbi:Heterogeneous nuclear ribonucleoprotein K [Armadillidium vulgare]|nr:Heterogeneous nuclear ribonucleoprotein K [Armadillidium vulgare]